MGFPFGRFAFRVGMFSGMTVTCPECGRAFISPADRWRGVLGGSLITVGLMSVLAGVTAATVLGDWRWLVHGSVSCLVLMVFGGLVLPRTRVRR
jgi:hypothetical protein